MTTVLLNETNEDQRNSNAKNNNNEQLFIHSLKRVVIMDVKTKLTIFISLLQKVLPKKVCLQLILWKGKWRNTMNLRESLKLTMKNKIYKFRTNIC